MSVTSSVIGNLQVTDNLTGDTSFLKQLLLSYTGTISTFAQSYLLGITPISVSLPGGSAQFVYIRNIPTTYVSNVTVTWTPNGGSSITVVTLSPGAAIILSETDMVNGITALSIVATAVNTPIEYIVAS